ncbi:MAG: hypothetical protein M3082_06740 [Candidatus Dormibacteraeota bacterium]|nr:hypothetical protein [Candidatus Dormibacteraeota bacterium]
MNDFDLRLEFHLRQLLAPLEAAPVPLRRKKSDRLLDAGAPERPLRLVLVPVEDFR